MALRVIQRAAGTVVRASLRAAARHPELELGVSNRVWLPPAGERFYAVCDRVLREVERAERLAQGEPGAGVLEIAGAPEVEAVPEALRGPLIQLLAAALSRGERCRWLGPRGGRWRARRARSVAVALAA